MAKTQAQIIAQALVELRALGSGQAVSSDQSAVFDVETAADYLAGLRVAYLTADVMADALPGEYFFPFSKLVAALHGGAFLLTEQQQEGLRSVALSELREIADRLRPVLPQQFDRMTY